MGKKRKNVVNSDIEEYISDLMLAIKNDAEASLTDKMKVLDRALKWEAIKLKAEDDAWGSGFEDGETDDN